MTNHDEIGGFSEPGPTRKVPKFDWAEEDLSDISDFDEIDCHDTAVDDLHNKVKQKGLSASAIKKVFDEAQELVGITFQQKVKIVLDDVLDYVCEKNRKYGDSALHPIRVFSKADPKEQLRVRLDDKLSRIRTCEPDDLEDSVKDLIGYLVLYRIGEKEAK